MKLLAIDIGSSSIKAAILSAAGNSKRIARELFATRYDGTRAEVDVRQIEQALAKAIASLGPAVWKVDAIAHATMAPSWLAMDGRGRAITPIVTHQDRRAIVEAKQIEEEIGRAEHLRLAGNRPFPGGISSTTWRWFNRHEKGLMRRATTVGHLSTWLNLCLCDARVTDPSNAAFMGVYLTTSLGGWSDELVASVGGKMSILPEIRDANVIAGHVKAKAGRDFGLLEGTPVLTGCLDGSAAMLAAGDRVGQLLNISGSTDVLALRVDQPKPHEQLLTRPLGVGRRWLAVGTLAAAGSAIEWARDTLYRDLKADAFYQHLRSISLSSKPRIQFQPNLAGSRTSMDELSGELTGLRLSTSRDEILAALSHGLAEASVERLARLEAQYHTILPKIIVSGGVPKSLTRILRRDWNRHGRWRFREIENATLRGLWNLANL